MNRSMNLIQLMTIQRLFCNKNTQRYACYKIIKILRQLASILLSISVNFGNIFELGQKNACCINVPNQKMILIYHIGRQNKMRYSYSGSESSMPWEGLKG